MKQRTLAKTVEVEGVGIHTGEMVWIKINPAKENNGITFIRTDLTPGVRIPAICENIKSALNASTVGVNGTRIGTVEHLMAALAGLGVDNAEIEVDGPEIPILDGSAAAFVDMIKSAGTVENDRPRSYLVVKRPVLARRNGSFSMIQPCPHTLIKCTISYNHPLLARQEMSIAVSPDSFEQEVSSARTFGFLSDVDRLRAMGLAKGGSLDNAVILDHEKVINSEGLRFKDEFVRHKVLDIVGDMALAGMPVLGEIIAYKTGHGLNHLLVQRLLSNPENFDIVGLEEVSMMRRAAKTPGARRDPHHSVTL